MDTDTVGAALDLDAIEARVNGTTPGPWRYVPARDAEDSPIVECDTPMTPYHTGFICETVYDMQSTTLRPTAGADADFIAHARQDVPALIAEVRRLRALRPPA